LPPPANGKWNWFLGSLKPWAKYKVKKINKQYKILRNIGVYGVVLINYEVKTNLIDKIMCLIRCWMTNLEKI